MSILQKKASLFLLLLFVTGIYASLFTDRRMVSFCEENAGVSEIFLLTTREARIYWRNKKEIKNENN